MFNVELSIGGHGGHVVVALRGELDLADAPAVASHLMTAVAASGPSIMVDLAGLEFIDCCGLRALLRVLQWTREGGGDLALAAPQQRVRKVLSLTGLIDVFSVYPSVEQAANGARLAQPVSARRAVANPSLPRMLDFADHRSRSAIAAMPDSIARSVTFPKPTTSCGGPAVEADRSVPIP